MSRLTAAIVGLGRVGQGYDYDASPDRLVLSHANAFAAHPGFELVAGVDPDPRERGRFTRKFSAPAYADVGGLLARHHPEVVAVAVPTPAHLPVFRELMAGGPRAMLCEKPIARSSKEAREMVGLAREHGCALAVNYMRRFEPGTRALAAAIREGHFGEIHKGVAWYSKGLLNNGSHFIDLLRFLLGGVSAVESVLAGRRQDGADPEPDVFLRFGGARIALLAGREECFSLQALELAGTRGMVRYLAGGEDIRGHFTHPDPVFPGETVLDDAPVTFPSDMQRYQWHVADALKRHLDSGEPLASDGDSALGTLVIVEQIVARVP